MPPNSAPVTSQPSGALCAKSGPWLNADTTNGGTTKASIEANVPNPMRKLVRLVRSS